MSQASAQDTSPGLFGQSWINGRARSYAAEQVASIDPATGRECGGFEACGVEAVDDAVSAASQAFATSWGRLSAAERAERLSSWGEKIAAAGDELARLEGLEAGRPVTDARTINGFAPYLTAEYGRMALGLAEIVDGSARRPRGVVAAITPWNAPVLNVVLRAAPILAAGNTLVLKPSELSPHSAVLLARLATEAGIPDGAFNVVLGTGPSAGAPLAMHPGVSLVTFTGSTATGKAIARGASAHSLKPLLLECGGKSPQIVAPDMIDEPALWRGVFMAAFWNTGQWCAAKSRLLVPAGKMETAVDGLAAAAAYIQVGRPDDPATILGPIASGKQFERVRSYREHARAAGRVVELPCARGEVDAAGFYVTPELCVAPPPASAVVQEEIFGPILTVHEYADADDAIRQANGTAYGLAGSIWSADRALAERMAGRLEVGLLTVLTTPGANPLLGEGGSFEPRKESGYGVEGGQAGLTVYTVPQAISFRQ